MNRSLELPLQTKHAIKLFSEYLMIRSYSRLLLGLTGIMGRITGIHCRFVNVNGAKHSKLLQSVHWLKRLINHMRRGAGTANAKQR
jgi:hypothetical protein